MDYSCCLWGGVPNVDGPGPGFFGATSEVGLQSQEMIGSPNELADSAFGDTKISEEFFGVRFIEISQFTFNLRTDDHCVASMMFAPIGTHSFHVLIAVRLGQVTVFYIGSQNGGFA